MSENQPIFSICIPTFNHAGYLFLTLKSIVEQNIFKFSDKIEIVVSDDRSTDFTEEIVKFFQEKFPEKIIYHKNEEKLGKRNTINSLTLAQGKVLKIHNDNMIFAEGALEKILNEIAIQEEYKPIIFFANGKAFYGENFLCKTLNSVVEQASYLCLYQSSFSIWKEDLEEVLNNARNCDLDFVLTNQLLKFITNRRKIFLYNENLFGENFVLQREFFNSAKFYGVTYLELLKPYTQNGFLSKTIYESEKKYLLKEKIIPTKFQYCVENKKWRIDKRAFWNVLLKNYWKDLYFYKSILKAFKLYVKSKAKNILKSLNPKNYQHVWKERNPHNQTLIGKKVDIRKVFVGKNSQGMINAKFTRNTNELLIIGDDVKIGENVKFVFGTKELIIIPDGFTIRDNSIITRSPQENIYGR